MTHDGEESDGASSVRPAPRVRRGVCGAGIGAPSTPRARNSLRSERVATLPHLEAPAAKRNSDGSAGALIRLVRPTPESCFGKGFDDPVLSRGGQVVSRSGRGERCSQGGWVY